MGREQVSVGLVEEEDGTVLVVDDVERGVDSIVVEEGSNEGARELVVIGSMEDEKEAVDDPDVGMPGSIGSG